MIALQAQYSDVSQRVTAEGVLHDYSSLIADEVIRRSAADIGYYGYYPLIGAVLHEVQQSGNLPGATKAALLSAPDARVKRAASLAKSYFQMDPPTGRLTFLAEEPGDEVAGW